MHGLNGDAKKEVSKNVRTIGHDELTARFPKLGSGNYKRTSKASARYNCMAYANNDDRHWWEPGLHGGRYSWPEGVKQSDTLEAWTEVFLRDGYELTDNKDIELGFYKVAIYVALDDMSPSHVAISDGLVWKSKLGKGQDIEHYDLAILEGEQADEYGIVESVLRRPVRP